MIKELERHGIDVDVLTTMPSYPKGEVFPGYGGTFRKQEELGGVSVRRVWSYAKTGPGALRRLTNYFSFTATSLVEVMRGPNPDLLFVESQPLSLGLVALALRTLRGVPYVYNVPDLQIEAAGQLGAMRNEAVLKVAKALEDVFLSKSWKIATVTDAFIAHFEERGCPREKLTFLPNGADTDFLRPMPADSELADRFGLRGKTIILYVGTHASYHGLDTLLDAAELLKDRKELAFLFVGHGPERERLKDLAKSKALTNVVFGDSPFEERDRLYSISYASIAIFKKMEVAQKMRPAKVFPSLSCGVPVIYSGGGETANLLSEHDCGLATAPGDAQALADGIATLTADRSRRDEMGRRGRAWVEREYGWGDIVSRWLKQIEA